MQAKHIIFIIILLGFSLQTKAQEELVGLQFDPVLNEYYQSHPSQEENKNSREAMFLPFLDDFNQEAFSPDPSLWEGGDVYINKKFQLFPPDLGVATFDAMDASGHIHENANQYAFPADTLTSQEIRLDSIKDPVLRPLYIRDSIYMSFYYQPQGRGNAPEEADRLSLEFYSPILDQWFLMWSSEGMPLETFFGIHGVSSLQVLIPLTDSAKFFHSGFKFRFHNLASLAGNSQPDWQSNCDHWNIDLVWIDKNRTVTDSSFRKVAFVNMPPSMIKHYQAMPYRQYKNDPTNSMKDTIKSIVIRNLDDVTYVASYQYEISNQTTQESLYDGGSADIEPFKDAGFVDYSRFKTPRVISFFSIYNETKKSYTITHTINDIGQTGVGDTAIRIQEFANYYAYDDGTAEAGYGMSVKNGRAAMKFKLNTKDTLRQVQFYFNPTFTGANDQYFDLMIWKNLDPEELIYTKRVKPVFTDGYYTFHTFDLDTSIVLANEFYVGFKQLKAENLNIGFDYAVDSREYLFYNIGEGWMPSIFSGSLMIRPVFGEKMPAAVNQIEKTQAGFSIYPNPLNTSSLHFDVKEGFINDYQLEIFNLTGQKLLSTRLKESINLGDFKSGMYLIRLINTREGTSDTQKLIIRR